MSYRPLIDWLNALLPLLRRTMEPIRILDVGFGYGDTLRRIERWAKKNKDSSSTGNGYRGIALAWVEGA
jgi:hypothetical protein